jgi:hypothetical protein
MKKTTVRVEMLKMRGEEVYGRFQTKRLTSQEASDLLGFTWRLHLAPCVWSIH